MFNVISNRFYSQNIFFNVFRQRTIRALYHLAKKEGISLIILYLSTLPVVKLVEKIGKPRWRAWRKALF